MQNRVLPNHKEEWNQGLCWSMDGMEDVMVSFMSQTQRVKCGVLGTKVWEESPGTRRGIRDYRRD